MKLSDSKHKLTCFVIMTLFPFYKNMLQFSGWSCSYKNGALLAKFQPGVLNPFVLICRCLLYWNSAPATRNLGLSWILSHGGTFAISKAMLTSHVHVRLLLLKYEVNHQSSCPFVFASLNKTISWSMVSKAFERSMIMTLLKSPLS